MEYLVIDEPGDPLFFAGHPLSVLFKHGDYFIKCKGVYIAYTSFLLWRKDLKQNVIGKTEEGRLAQISQRAGFTRISCLRSTNKELNNLETKIKKIITCHKKQLAKKIK